MLPILQREETKVDKIQASQEIINDMTKTQTKNISKFPLMPLIKLVSLILQALQELDW